MIRLLMTFMVIGLCLASNFVNAQTISGKISGKIVDDMGRPVDAATVSLYRIPDSVTVKYELSAVDGSFYFKGIKEGSYRIHISTIGYLLFKTNPFNLDSMFPDIQLSEIIVYPDTRALKEVVITSAKPFIEHLVDRTVVNVGDMLSNAGASALEVLEKSPGVTIDQDGAISFHGKSGVAIYIDDRPSYLSGSDLENFLRSMPSSMLNQVEFITNPPAKYDAAGTAGIINIKTKKNKLRGFNLGMNASLRQSRYSTTNNSLDFNYRKDKVNVFGTVGYTLSNSFNDVDISRHYFYNEGQTSGAFNQNSYINRKGESLNASGGMDINASEKTAVGILFSGLIRTSRNNNKSKGELLNELSQPDSLIFSENGEHGKFKNGSANVNYRHTFRQGGPEISANLDYLSFATNQNQLFRNENYSAGTLLSYDQLLGRLPAGIKIYAAKVDYSQPIAGGWKLSSGAKSSSTITDNQADYFKITAGEAISDFEKTNHFLYKEAFNAGYLNLNKDFERLSVQAGLRLENTYSRGNQLGNAQRADSTFNRNYTSLFPTFYLLYKLDTLGDHQLKLSYGRRIERPYYQDLNPFISPLDKYTYYSGNPYLRPSYSGNFELGYIYKNRINVTLNYIDIRDRVTETIEIRSGYYYDRPGNIGSTKLYDLNVDASFEPASWFILQISGDAWHIRETSHFYTGILKSHSTNYSTQAMLQFKLKGGWKLQTDGKYQSKQTDGQFTIASKGRLNVGASKVLSPRSTVKLNINDVLYSNITQGLIGNLDRTNARFRTLSDSRAAVLSLNIRLGKSVAGQREHDRTGAGEEHDRVKN